MKVRIGKASNYKFEEEREYKSLDECIPALFKEFSPDPEYPNGLLIYEEPKDSPSTMIDYSITIADDYLD